MDSVIDWKWSSINLYSTGIDKRMPGTRSACRWTLARLCLIIGFECFQTRSLMPIAACTIYARENFRRTFHFTITILFVASAKLKLIASFTVCCTCGRGQAFGEGSRVGSSFAFFSIQIELMWQVGKSGNIHCQLARFAPFAFVYSFFVSFATSADSVVWELLLCVNGASAFEKSLISIRPLFRSRTSQTSLSGY